MKHLGKVENRFKVMSLFTIVDHFIRWAILVSFSLQSFSEIKLFNDVTDGTRTSDVGSTGQPTEPPPLPLVHRFFSD